MPSSEENLLSLIKTVDKTFSNRGLILSSRLRVPLVWSKLLFVFVGIALLGWGYYLAQIAVSAANANLLELAVALDSIALSALAIVFSILALTTGTDWRRREDSMFASRIFNKLNDSTTDPIVLHQLVRMRMSIPKPVTLERTYKANKDLFNEKELARRFFDL